ncbi:hypothetical protein [Streptomyces sp. NPDC002172]
MTTTVNADAARIIDQLRSGQALATKAGLGGPEMDATYDVIIRQIAEATDPKARMREIVDLLERDRAHTSKCSVFPDWCGETGPHDDHVSRWVEVVDTKGETLIDAKALFLSDSKPIVGISGSDFTPAEARAKAAELRKFADQVEELAGHADKAASR